MVFGLGLVVAKKRSVELVVLIYLDVGGGMGCFLQVIDIEILVYDGLGSAGVSTIWERLDFDLVAGSWFQVVLLVWVVLTPKSILESMELLCLSTLLNLSWN